MVLALVAAAWAVWAHRIGISDLDDAASNEVLFAREPLSTILFDLKWADQSPLYFVVLHFWRALGESPGWIKGLNLVALTAAVALLYDVGRLLTGSGSVAVASVALAVLSPASFWLVRNGRMYSLQLLLWVVCLYGLARYADERRRRHLVVFGSAAVLSIYNHFVGFAAAASALVWLALEERGRVARPAADGHDGGDGGRWWTAPLATALGVLVLTLPQVGRAVHLLTDPPRLIPGWSVPAGRVAFLDHLSWFWFVNSDWGALRDWGTALRPLYLASVYVLFVVGLSERTGRLARAALATVVIPVALGAVAAGHVDLRHRYFIHLLPVIWIVVANGAVGALGAGAAAEDRRSVVWARTRPVLLAVVALGSAWLAASKLPERYAEWAKVWAGLRQIGHARMALYMPPGPTTSTPTLLASHDEPPILGPIRPLSPETRPEFLSHLAGGGDVALLVQSKLSNAEFHWRGRHLRTLGYRKVVLRAWGAEAHVFYRRELPAFSRITRLESRPVAAEVVRWARGRLQDPSRAAADRGGLEAAVVARVMAGGEVHESTFFVSQRGESGSWRIGPAVSDAVTAEPMRMGRGHADVLRGRARDDSLLVVAQPGVDAGRGLSLRCGRAAGGRPSRRVEALAEVFVDGRRAAEGVCPAAAPDAGEALEIEAGAAGSGPADVTVLLTAIGGDASVWFRLDPSRAAPRPLPSTPASSPALITASRPLSTFADRLRVHRTNHAGFGRRPSRFETSGVPAAVLHERPGPRGEGALARHWRTGEAPWDVVGPTRQRSAGEVRAGLWAHPRAGTTLVIEADRVRLGRVLEGFYGLTDIAVEQSRAGRVADPVRLRVFVDGTVVLSTEAARTAGWRPLSADLPSPGREAGLRIEIDAERDSWAHFVLDLWSP